MKLEARLIRAFAAALLGFGAASLPASEAAAQVDRTRAGGETGNGDGMDLHLFRPAIDSKGFFSVNGADILGANDFSLGLVIDYGHNLLPLADNPDDVDAMLTHAFQGTFQFNYGIANWLTVGLSAPVILSNGDPISELGPGPGANYADDEADAQALGNLAFHVKLRLLRPDTDPIGLAIIAQAGYGVGGTADLSAEPGFWYWPQLVLEKRVGATDRFRVGANVGFRGHTGANARFGTRTDGTPLLENGAVEYGNLATGGLAMSLRVLGPLDLVAESYGTYLLGGDSDPKQRLSAEAIGGLKLFIERNSFLMLAGGVGYLPGFQSAAQRATIGFVFEPSIGDRDGDGIKDDEDDCPNEPEDFDGFQDTKGDSPEGQYGCPDPDNDNDGILDVDDR
ncbi:MAG TPA: hypothetical protein VLS89_11855, partial [Candidatus Nanopelagicales bacterium]|nr:hypothetical protein [Candidatus Nanopelagicales bacterium]